MLHRNHEFSARGFHDFLNKKIDRGKSRIDRRISWYYRNNAQMKTTAKFNDIVARCFSNFRELR